MVIGPIKPFIGTLTPKKRPGVISKVLAKLGVKGMCQHAFARTESGATCQNNSPEACSRCASGWLRAGYLKDGKDYSNKPEDRQAYNTARQRFLSVAMKLYPNFINKVFHPTIVSINDAYLTPRRVIRVFKEAGL